jgi:NAD(P)H-dependent flavin oxidoreductase YrpB (nitropropane dioxygenase family)
MAVHMLASGNAAKFGRSTRVAQQLGIDYPIIQAPFGGLLSQRLTATVSNLGGLGSLGAVTLGASAISEVIGEIRSLTSKPFAINLWVSTFDRFRVATRRLRKREEPLPVGVRRCEPSARHTGRTGSHFRSDDLDTRRVILSPCP